MFLVGLLVVAGTATASVDSIRQHAARCGFKPDQLVWRVDADGHPRAELTPNGNFDSFSFKSMRCLLNWAEKSGVKIGFVSEPATSTAPEIFTDSTFGLSIQKPADWRSIPVQANAVDRQKVMANNPDLVGAIQKDAAAPLYAFTRTWEPDRRIAATVKIGVRSADSFEGMSGEKVLDAILVSLRDQMHVTVVTAPEVVSLAGQQTGHFAITYALKDSEGPVYIASEMWVIPRGKYFVVLGATYPPADRERDHPEVMKIVDSLRLTK